MWRGLQPKQNNYMQLTLEQYERIQKYLDGVMTPREEQEFLVELDQNISLKENFDFEKKLRENLTSIEDKKNLLEKPGEFDDANTTSEDRESIKSLIKKAGNEWEEENKNISGVTQFIIDHKPRPHKAKIVNLRSWSVIAAAACVVLAVASLVWFMPEIIHYPFYCYNKWTPPLLKKVRIMILQKLLRGIL